MNPSHPISTAPEPSADQPAPIHSQSPAPQPIAEPASPPNSQPSTLNSQPSFPLHPGETPRAYAAFTAYFQLGHGRSHQAVADQLDEKCHTVRNWASRYHWTDRLNAFNSSLLEQQAQTEAEARRQMAADWVRRSNEYREMQWLAAQKLLNTVHGVLESFGDREIERLTLSEIARTFQIASRIARETLRGSSGSEAPALHRACGQPLPEFEAAVRQP